MPWMVRITDLQGRMLYWSDQTMDFVSKDNATIYRRPEALPAVVWTDPKAFGHYLTLPRSQNGTYYTDVAGEERAEVVEL